MHVSMSCEESAIVLADDATGALECASILAGFDYPVQVSIGAPARLNPTQGILVVDLESRKLKAEDARLALRGVLDQLREEGTRRIYLKTDSTLRGHIGVSLIEVLDGTNEGPVVYVPAYPKLRRTVREGCLYVDGVALEKTAFAMDVRHPVASSSLLDLFRGEALGRVSSIRDADELRRQLEVGERKILICDGGTEDDLKRISQVLRDAARGHLVAGPAGFLSEWASFGTFTARPPQQRPHPKNWLVVCGSLHPQSRAQVAQAVALGIPTIASDAAENSSPEQAANELSKLVVERVNAAKPEAMLIMGGDTAFAVWKALGVHRLEPLPELLPGVAACLSRELNMVFVTKAGGFGEHGVVQQVIEIMR